MNKVISQQDARKITGGRLPNVPIVYEQAIQALAACLTLDETRHWDNKADALAAWAKIYRDDKVLRQAKALKLHAYRRMGIIARELRPPRVSVRNSGRFAGHKPGHHSLLQEAGLNVGQATGASYLSRIDEKKFLTLANRQNPPTPQGARANAFNNLETIAAGISRTLSGMRAVLPRVAAQEWALNDNKRGQVREISDWIDEFERAASMAAKR